MTKKEHWNSLETGQKIWHICQGMGWALRTMFWVFMIRYFSGIIVAFLPDDKREDMLLSCIAKGEAIRQEARDRYFLD